MKKAKRLSVQHYRSKLLLLICAVCLLLMAGCAAKQTITPPPPEGQANAVSLLPVEKLTTEGIVIGEENAATNTISWKAIPYAEPPVGALRWRAPQAPQKRSVPLKATKYCDICPQYIDHDRNPSTPQVVLGNEDCLYLNIWAPKNATADSKLPVFFWIHGGGNSIQWPLLSALDGGILANKGNMIVITVNYRIGHMGFLNHPALKTGDAAEDSGNFGILDLIAALKWVQANINNFGGDTGNVTIVGESAGGHNVFALVLSPMAKGLFQRAITESGSSTYFATPEQGAAHINGILAKIMVKEGQAANEKEAASKLAAMSAKDIATYMRSKKPQDFLEYYPEGKADGLIQFPNVFGDGKVLPVDFYSVLAAGNYNKVPMIMGTNKDEAKLFLRTVEPFKHWLMYYSLYKEPSQLELYDLVAKYESEAWKVMAVDQPARIMRGISGQPDIFTYQFLWGTGGQKDSVIGSRLSVMLAACHAMEIDFVFGTDNAALGVYVFDKKNRPGRVALSDAIMDYWAQFARTGNPNREGSELPDWIPWSNVEGQPKTILLDADLEKIKISMSDKELKQEDIDAALKAEPRQKEIQPLYDAIPYKRR